jgi:hypothetical protein
VRTLGQLSDEALTRLAVATNVQGPATTLAPVFWRFFGDQIAHECALRHGLVEAADQPTLPASISNAELENGCLILAALAETERAAGDQESADLLIEIAEEGVLIRKSGLFEGALTH